MKIIHSKNYSIRKNYSKKIFIQQIWKLFIQKNYSFFWKIDYRPGLAPGAPHPRIRQGHGMSCICKLKKLTSRACLAWQNDWGQSNNSCDHMIHTNVSGATLPILTRGGSFVQILAAKVNICYDIWKSVKSYIGEWDSIHNSDSMI